MIRKKLLQPDRIRHIEGSFGFIPHRFLTDGFLASLTQKELLLYFFLVLVSDRQGLSFYGYESICTLLELSIDQYIEARDALVRKDLIAFDGTLFQVLALPEKPAKDLPLRTTLSCEHSKELLALGQILSQCFRGGDGNG
jgi:hypothetical protein